jgi:hypothetical protein
MARNCAQQISRFAASSGLLFSKSQSKSPRIFSKADANN